MNKLKRIKKALLFISLCFILLTTLKENVSTGFHFGTPSVIKKKVKKLEKKKKDIMSISADSLDFGQITSTTTFIITNRGNDDLIWSIDVDKTWITVSPSNGTTKKGHSTEITVTVQRDGLSHGSHTGTITINSDVGKKLSQYQCMLHQF